MSFHIFQTRALLFLCLACAPLWAADKKRDPDAIGERDIGRGVNFYSIEKEIAMGRQMAVEVERQAKLIDDPLVSEYVNRIGQNIVRNSDAKVPFTIKVIDSEEVNAFALPGGYMFVHSGLILRTDNEAELAGVLAHEVAHVAARHGTRQATRGQIINFATIPLIFIGGLPGYIAQQALGVAVPLGFLKFSRGMEKEADLFGIQYMYKAGYDPVAFIDFFEEMQALEKKKKGSISQLFSSHPMTKDRIRFSQKVIEKDLDPQPQYVVTTSEYERVKERVRMLQNRWGGEEDDDGKPTLKRRSSGKVTSAGEQAPEEEEERPKLKRR
jgi:predicted Zn-dependent protease